MYQRRLIQLAFGALVLENEAQYHGLILCNISAYNARISCKNFVKFCPVTSELTGLICERQVCRGQKTGVIYGISLYLLHRFSHSFHHMKAHYVQMMNV